LSAILLLFVAFLCICDARVGPSVALPTPSGAQAAGIEIETKEPLIEIAAAAKTDASIKSVTEAESLEEDDGLQVEASSLEDASAGIAALKSHAGKAGKKKTLEVKHIGDVLPGDATDSASELDADSSASDSSSKEGHKHTHKHHTRKDKSNGEATNAQGNTEGEGNGDADNSNSNGGHASRKHQKHQDKNKASSNTNAATDPASSEGDDAEGDSNSSISDGSNSSKHKHAYKAHNKHNKADKASEGDAVESSEGADSSNSADNAARQNSSKKPRFPIRQEEEETTVDPTTTEESTEHTKKGHKAGKAAHTGVLSAMSVIPFVVWQRLHTV
jgi:hypothetical protein